MPFVPDNPSPVAPRGKFVPDAPPADVVTPAAPAAAAPAYSSPDDPLLNRIFGVKMTDEERAARLRRGILSLPTEMGGGGLTPEEAKIAEKSVRSTAVRGGAPVAGFLLGGPAGGALGGAAGEYAAEKLEGGPVRPGAILASGITGGIPGGPLAGQGLGRVALEGAKQGAAGLLAKNVETVIDEGRLATPKEALISTAIPAAGGALAQRIQGANPEIQAAVAAAPGKSVKSQTLDAAKDLGMAITPSDVNDSWLNKRLESLAGPADVRRGAAIKNQQVANRVAAQELGLPPKTEITIPVLNEVRKKAAKPYEEIGQMAERAKAEIAQIQKEKFTATDPHELAIQMADPETVKRLAPLELQAGADLQALREARDLMNANRPPYPQADAERLKLFRDTQDKVEALEANIEAAAIAAGRPELVKELRDSRQLIAKSHDIERALNVGDADVSLPILGRMEDRGRPLSGNLEKLGKFAEAFPRNVTEGARTLRPGLSKTEIITGGLLAGGGFGATGNPYLLLGGIVPPVASTAARRLVLSSPYQRMVANLPKSKVAADPDEIAATTRILSQMVAKSAAEEEQKKKP